MIIGSLQHVLLKRDNNTDQFEVLDADCIDHGSRILQPQY